MGLTLQIQCMTWDYQEVYSLSRSKLQEMVRDREAGRAAVHRVRVRHD